MAKRFGKKVKSGKDYFNLRDRAVKDPSLSFTLSELEKAWKARKDMAGPYEYDHANVLRWVKDNGIEHYGSIAEADQQLVRLEIGGIIDGIITEDSDIAVLKAMTVFSKM